MAAGKVITGFSKPYVALYAENGGTVTYTKQQVLARGVNVSIEPTTPDENAFYADNVQAETAPGVFTGGTLTLTVDGLLETARSLVFGLPEPTPLSDTDTTKIYKEGEKMSIPYVGVGFVVRYQSGGVVSYTPMVLTKVRFNTPSTEAQTQEENINWQTEELTANIMRDDTADKNWKIFAEGQETEADAEKILQTLLGGTATQPDA